MSITARYDSELNLVETILSGTVTPADLREEIVLAAALAEEHDCALFLSDFSQAKTEFSFVDVYYLPAMQDDHGLRQSIRVAVLAPSSKIGRELVHFYDTVSVNRGWITQVFSNRQEAINWLLKKQPS